MFTTKQKLSKDKFYQGLNDQLILTGNTYISKFSGDTTSFKNIGINISNYDFFIGEGVSNGSGGGQVWDVALQSDGKVLVVGDFNTYDGTTVGYGVMRLHSDGRLDENFNINVGDGAAGYIQRVLIQPSDNKILLLGEFSSFNSESHSRLVRLDVDGNIDSTFVTGTGFDMSTYNGIDIQSDGKIIVTGDFTSYSGITANRIVRLNTNGGLDSSFITGTGFDAFVSDVLVQDDDKIIVSGLFATYSGITANGLVRLNSNGGVDDSFVIGGGFTPGAEFAYRMALQPDGKILFGGVFTQFSGITANNILRLNTNGGVDSSFLSGSGIVGTGVNSINVMGDGKILLAGEFDTYDSIPSKNLVCLNSDGTINETFNVGFLDALLLTVTSTGDSIYLGGNFTTYNNVPAKRLIKIDNTGVSLSGEYNVLVKNTVIGYDNTYHASGLTDNALTPKVYVDNYIQPESGIIKSGGTISLGGRINNNIAIRGNGFFVKNLNNIQLLNKYSKGISINGDYGVDEDVYDILSTTGGSIYISTESAILKYNSSHVLENVLPIPSGETMCETDDYIYVGGRFNYEIGTDTFNKLLRISKSNFAVDTTFDIGTGFNDTVTVITVDEANDKLLIGGNFTTYNGATFNRIIRINFDGSVDETFVNGTGFNTSVNDIKLQDDGKILVAGSFISYSGVTRNRIIRLNSNGGIDSGFVIGTGFNSSTNKIDIQSDGKICVVGLFSAYNGTTLSGGFARLNSDGSYDNTFNNGDDSVDGSLARVFDVLVDDDDKILMVGVFTQYSGQTTNRIVRTNADGTPDYSFNVGTGLNTTGGFTTGPNIIRKVGSTQYLAGGAFSLYQDKTALRLVLINDDGSYATAYNPTVGITGIAEYDVDYSSGFTKHSIVDVNYVTGITSTLGDNTLAGNGLTKTGDVIKLGGVITGDSAIQNTINSIILNSTDYPGEIYWSGFDGTDKRGYLFNYGTRVELFVNKNDTSFGYGLAPVLIGYDTIDFGQSKKVTFNGNTGLLDYNLSINSNTGVTDNTLISYGFGKNNFITKNISNNLANTSDTQTVLTTGNIGVGSTNIVFKNDSGDALATSITIQDSQKRGLQYAGDYSTGFTKHSLVDVNYVTGITSTISANVANGLSKDAGTIVLGGALTTDTTITATGSTHDTTISLGNSAFNAAFAVTTEYNDGFTMGSSSLEVKHFNGTVLAFDDLNGEYNQFKVGSSGIEATSNGNNFAKYAYFDVSNANQYGKPDEQPQVFQQIVEEDGTVNDVLFSQYGFDVVMRNVGGDDLAKFTITKTGTTFTDGRTVKRGIQYTSNYSSGFTKHSIVDVNYVTGITSQISTSLVVFSGSVAGNVVVDLTTADIFLLNVTGNVTSFNYTGETIGKQYMFKVIMDTSNKSFTWASGRYRFPFGTTPVLTNPTTNGSSPAHSEDIITAICMNGGRLDIVTTPDMQSN